MLVQRGLLASEITEYLSYRHSFLRVTQTLYPSVRLDTLPGQHYHLTQLPSHVNIDPTTGLSPTYQLVIRFDTNYRDFSKIDVQEAAASRFEVMHIPLATRFREPICAIVDRASTKWLGFLKVDLLNPHTDGLALLRGERIFTLLLRNKYVVGKIEKGFGFNSTSSSRKIKIQSPILTRYNSRHLLAKLIRLGYASSQVMEFVGVSKRIPEQDFAEITLVTEDTKNYLLSSPIFLEGERVTVTTPATPNSTQNLDAALTTSLIVKGLPMQHSQLQITAAVHKLLGAKNAVTITYNRAQSDEFGRHDGITTIRCLNSVVYTHWANRRSVPFLGKNIDFSPHRRSLVGASPSAAARQHDARPTCETLVDAIIAMQNSSWPAPSLEELEVTMKGVEARIDAPLSALGNGINIHMFQATFSLSAEINTHTIRTAEISTGIHNNHHPYLSEQLRHLTEAFGEYNRRMTAISSALLHGPPESTIALHHPFTIPEDTSIW
jgi:hypothetical protein